ncbi:hypothetical protein ABIC22_002001 [Paenibacillus sp. PvP094]
MAADLRGELHPTSLQFVEGTQADHQVLKVKNPRRFVSQS